MLESTKYPIILKNGNYNGSSQTRSVRSSRKCVVTPSPFSHSDEEFYLDHLLDAGCEEERGPDDGGDGQLDRQQGVHLPHEP